MIVTYNFRIKDSTSRKKLCKLASSVNFVWNYCNATSFDAIRNRSKFLSAYDLNALTAGSSTELGLQAHSIYSIDKEYVLRRRQFKKRKLRWRSAKRSLGWIPFQKSGVKIQGSEVVYMKQRFKMWKHRELEGKIKTGSFNQDSLGRWYVNFNCEIEDGILKTEGKEIGIDLGIKDKLTLSNGEKFNRDNLTQKFAEKLAKKQRAKKKNQARRVHIKIKNKRKDWNHKVTHKIISASKLVAVGDLKLQKTGRLAKSIYDSGFHQITNLLQYKAIRHGVRFVKVNESYSTITCSVCFARKGPSGLSGLDVREWNCCSCGSVHDRDINAARNILRCGIASLN